MYLNGPTSKGRAGEEEEAKGKRKRKGRKVWGQPPKYLV